MKYLKTVLFLLFFFPLGSDAFELSITESRLVSDDFYASSKTRSLILDYKPMVWSPKRILVRNSRSLEAYRQVLQQYKSTLDSGMRFAGSKLKELQDNAIHLIRQESDANPIWALTECTDEHCNLTRTNHSRPRSIFEKEVVKTIVEAKANTDRAVNLVDFASGGIFEDLIIVSQALENGVEAINLYLIDTTYYSIIGLLDNSLPKSHQWKQHPISAYPEIERLKQLYTWFKVAYQDKDVQIYLFPTMEEYLLHMNKNTAQKADVFISSDIDATDNAPLDIYLQAALESFMWPTGVGILLYDGSNFPFRRANRPFFSLVKTTAKNVTLGTFERKFSYPMPGQDRHQIWMPYSVYPVKFVLPALVCGIGLVIYPYLACH